MSKLMTATHLGANRFRFSDGVEWIVYPEFVADEDSSDVVDFRIYTQRLDVNRAFYHYPTTGDDGYECEFLEGLLCISHDTNARHDA